MDREGFENTEKLQWIFSSERNPAEAVRIGSSRGWKPHPLLKTVLISSAK